MMGMTRPWVLLCLLAIPAWAWWRRHRSAPLEYPDVALADGVTTGAWRSAIPGLLRGLALASLVVAAAGPDAGGGSVEERREGISIVIAIDISSSMLAEDFAPSNRLEVAKRKAIEFVRGREADRIGLVAFAGEALTQVPITLDYPVLEQAIMDLRIGSLEDGTAIGSGLATSVNRLRRSDGKSRVVLLLTDGENNRGRIDPRTAAASAEAYGVRVYTIGVGTEGEAPIPTGRGMGGFRYEVLPVRIDETLLKEIAATTGGRYFRAHDADALGRVFQQIDELETTPVTLTRYARHDEATGPFLVAGAGLLLLQLLLGATVLRRIP
jgi:Ca-activated chloride channel family protein